jgi:glutamine synthetase
MSTKVIAEYIWLDGSSGFRSKCRTLEVKTQIDIEVDNLPLWNYDGSSTGQSEASNSDVTLQPVAVFSDPFRGQNSVFVLCATYDCDGNPLANNHRHNAVRLFNQDSDAQPWFGIEQEYFMMNPNTKWPLGFPPNGYPKPQGNYYCSVGTLNNFGRKIADLHYKMCLASGVKIAGINAETAPGQWEFQVGPCEGIEAGDHLTMARYILERVSEFSSILIDYSPKPVKGDWNGSGCHVNYSTRHMRKGLGDKRGIDFIQDAIKNLEKTHSEHMKVYGEGNEKRMTGSCETSDYNSFSWGVATRNTSVRVPRQVNEDECGYLEDRRPASNIDPYVVTSKIFETTVLSTVLQTQSDEENNCQSASI